MKKLIGICIPLTAFLLLVFCAVSAGASEEYTIRFYKIEEDNIDRTTYSKTAASPWIEMTSLRMTVAAEKTFMLPSLPKENGKTFSGWYVKDDFNPRSELAKIPEYKLNGKTYNCKSLAPGNLYLVSIDDSTYDFLEHGILSTSVAGYTATALKNMNFYCVSKSVKDAYTVEYYVNGKKDTSLTQICAKNVAYTFPILPSAYVTDTYPGQSSENRICAWNDKKDFSGESFSSGVAFMNLAEPGKTIKLYTFTYRTEWYVDGKLEMTGFGNYGQGETMPYSGFILSYASDDLIFDFNDCYLGKTDPPRKWTDELWHLGNLTGPTETSVFKQPSTLTAVICCYGRNVCHESYTTHFRFTSKEYKEADKITTGYITSPYSWWRDSDPGNELITKTPGDTVKFYTSTDYRITYDKNSGGDTVTNMPVTAYKTWNKSYTLSKKIPVRKGYVFEGWYTASNGGTKYGTTLAADDNSLKTLYAHWIPETNRITYKWSDGTVIKSDTYVYGKGKEKLYSQTAPAYHSVTPQAAAVWSTTAKCTDSVSSIGANEYGDKTFYKKKTPETFPIEYRWNNGIVIKTDSYTFGTEKTLIPKPSVTGYEVYGWYSDKACTIAATVISKTDHGSKVFYVKKTPKVYTIRYKWSDGTLIKTDSYTYGIGLEKLYSQTPPAGYSCKPEENAAWSTIPACSDSVLSITKTATGDKTFYKEKTPKTYTITYKWNDGTLIKKDSYTCGTAKSFEPRPSVTGYDVFGWYLDKECTATASAITKTTTGNKVFYVYKTPKVYRITYKWNDGTIIKTDSYTYGTAKSLIEKPSVTGYDVNGWYSDKECTSEAGSITVSTIGDKIFYVKKEPVPYSVRFNGNGKTSGSMSDQQFVYGKAQNLFANSYVRKFTVTCVDGTETVRLTAKSSFAGWSKTKTGMVAYTDKQNVKNLTTVKDTVIYLYAKWTDKSVKLPEPEKPGYSFDGWFDEDGSVIGGGGDEFVPDEDIKIYARWTPNILKVYYRANGGKINAEKSDSYYLNSKTTVYKQSDRTAYYQTWTYNKTKENGLVNANTFGLSKENCSFVGWNTKADGTGIAFGQNDSAITPSDLNTAIEDGDTSVILYAQWKQKGLLLEIEAVAPNAKYREKTTVITSFHIVNPSKTDCTPDKNISVRMTVFNDNKEIATKTVSGVAVPANEKNLYFIRWDVPANCGEISVTAEIFNGNKTIDSAAGTYATMKYTVYSTPDTQYEASAPSDFSVPATPSEKTETKEWYVWEYDGGRFVRKNYSLSISAFAEITPSATANSWEEAGKFYTKSGYGISISANDKIVTAADDTTYTTCQYAVAEFPEFGYYQTKNKCRTLELVSSKWLFRENGNYGRVHFTPLWYPNGDYRSTVVISDCWTPAGMVSKTVHTNAIGIRGSAYDDWFID